MDETNLPSPAAHRHHDRLPYWKRAHHDWKFRVGLVLMLVAISIYVVTNDLSMFPSGRQKQLPNAVTRVP